LEEKNSTNTNEYSVTRGSTELGRATGNAPLAYAQPYSTGAKRRFDSLPINFKYTERTRLHRALRSHRMIQMRARRLGLLRAALRRRLNERPVVDLKKWANLRRTPRDQVLPP